MYLRALILAFFPNSTPRGTARTTVVFYILVVIDTQPNLLLKKITMKLTHLGASYTPSTNDIETVETKTELRFLGHGYKMRTHNATLTRIPEGKLTYRGARYKA